MALEEAAIAVQAWPVMGQHSPRQAHVVTKPKMQGLQTTDVHVSWGSERPWSLRDKDFGASRGGKKTRGPLTGSSTSRLQNET